MFINPYLTPLDWGYQEAEAVSSRDALTIPWSCVDSIWGWPVEERPFIMERFDSRGLFFMGKEMCSQSGYVGTKLDWA
jgi:hypothetical protein